MEINLDKFKKQTKLANVKIFPAGHPGAGCGTINEINGILMPTYSREYSGEEKCLRFFTGILYFLKNISPFHKLTT